MSGTESGGATGAPTVTEYLVRIPTKADKRFNLMKFNIAGDSDFARWTQARMERENNQRDTSAGKNEAEEIPKFGAGSEYGREAKEEARLKRLGIRRKKYNPESQPWLLRVGGKGGKRFKGIREGGVTENASFYVFTQAADGAFEAHPVSEWYNFTPVQRFKALTAEEAEEEFGRRDRIMNFFSVMVKKKCKAEEGEEAADTSTKEEKGSKKKGASKKGAEDLQISEMDEWVSDDDADEDDDEEEEAAGKEGKKKKKKKEEDDDDGVPKKKKKKKKDEDDEKDSEEEENPLEESDDGDEEGREMDYDSASSASDAELLEAMEERGVDEDMASSSSSEEEGEGEKKEGEKKEGEGAEEETASGDKKKKKKKKVKTPPKKKEKPSESTTPGEAGGSSSSEFSDSDIENEAALSIKKKQRRPGSGPSSRSVSPYQAATGGSPAEEAGGPSGEAKRKADSDSVGQQVSKRMKLSLEGGSGGGGGSAKGFSLSPLILAQASEAGITEEAIRRYLSRKPMTAKELLQKLKNKKSTQLSKEQLVNIVAQLLKKIDPEKKKIKETMYFSLRT